MNIIYSNQLKVAIKTAFKNVPYPGDNNIGDPEGRDDAESVARALRGVSWRNLARRKDLRHLSLYYMTPEACQYYLPAYLIVSMKSPYGQAMQGVKLRLKPYEGPHPYPKEIFSAFVDLLLPMQKQVVLDFLLYSRSAIENFCLEQERKEILELEEEGAEEAEKESWRHLWGDIRDAERAEFNSLVESWTMLSNHV